MLRVVGCITQDHDLRLVALACLVCLLSAHTSARLLNPRRDVEQEGARALHAPQQPPSWRSMHWASGPPISSACWPSARTSRSALTCTVLCILSLVLSIAATAIAYTIRPRERSWTTRRSSPADWFSRQASVRWHFRWHAFFCIVPGTIHYDPDLVVASLSLGASCSITAMGNAGAPNALRGLRFFWPSPSRSFISSPWDRSRLN